MDSDISMFGFRVYLGGLTRGSGCIFAKGLGFRVQSGVGF